MGILTKVASTCQAKSDFFRDLILTKLSLDPAGASKGRLRNI